ncbi:MAG TPA: MarR family transcriptional regulator [Gemmatimonadaceae bacterium]|jgi:DNA-binding MarR family transcriptional regulator
MTKSSPARAASSANTNMLSAVSSIRRIVRVLRLASQHTQTVAGISAAQLFVLQQLGDGSARSLNELAERTLTDRSSVAAVVERLQAQRLVDRTADPADRRRAAIRITAAGRRILQRAPDAPTTTLLGALRRLSPGELNALAHSLNRLTLALGAAHEPPSMLFAEEVHPRSRGSRAKKSRKRAT